MDARFAFRMLEQGGGLHGGGPSRVSSGGIFVLPIGLQAYSDSRDGRVQALEVRDGTVVDMAGAAGRRFRLEGNFGSKYKPVGGVMDGRMIVADLTAWFSYFFDEVKRRTLARSPLLEMGVDDFVNGAHWIAIPQGTPEVRANAREPMRPSFSVTMIGVRPAASTSAPSNPATDALSPSTLTAVGNSMTVPFSGSF